MNDAVAEVLLDVAQEYRVADVDNLYGQTKSRSMPMTRARYEMWRRLRDSGMKQFQIAALFGVTKAAVSIGLKRLGEEETLDGACPCCGRPRNPALGRGG